MTNAISTAGTLFQQDSVGRVNEATLYTTLEEVTSVSGLEITTDTVEVTALASVAKEYIQGLPDASSVSVEMNWIDSVNQQNVRNRHEQGLFRSYRLIFPDGSGVSFGGVIDSFSLSTEPNAPITASFTIKLSFLSVFDSLRWGMRLQGGAGSWRATSAADPWSGSGLTLNQTTADITTEFWLRADSVDGHSGTLMPWPATECTIRHEKGGAVSVVRVEILGIDPTPFKIIPHTNHHIKFRTDGAGAYTLTFDGVEFAGTYTVTYPTTAPYPGIGWPFGGEFEGTCWDWKIYNGVTLHHAWPLIGNAAGEGNGTTGVPADDFWIDEPTTGTIPARVWENDTENGNTCFWWLFPYTNP